MLSFNSFLSPNQRITPQVNVSVNGHPIPFDMKIGEAGEAFFVFETDDEVPADLITSPLLQPTLRPDEARPAAVSVPPSNFDPRQGQDGSEFIHPTTNDRTYNGTSRLRKRELDTLEPEFLDLDAPLPSPPQEEDEAFRNVNIQRAADRPSPQLLSQASIPQLVRPAHILPSPPLTPTHTHSVHNTEEMLAQDKRVDEAIMAAKDTLFQPEVEYHHGQWHQLPSSYELTPRILTDIALDVEGYHAHTSEHSDHTVASLQQFAFPSSTTSSLSSLIDLVYFLVMTFV